MGPDIAKYLVIMAGYTLIGREVIDQLESKHLPIAFCR